jgi:hypothetical protein
MTAVTSYSGWVGFDLNSNRNARVGKIEFCPMCGAHLRISFRSPDEYQFNFLAGHMAEVTFDPWRLLECECCRWWGVEEKGADTDNRDYYLGFHFLVSAVCKWYDIGDKDAPAKALCDYFRGKDEIDFKSIHPAGFEKLIAECLRCEFGPCEVHHVGAAGGSGDRGIDIYMVKDDTTWLVQVKRRLNDKPESVDTIRLLNGVLLRDGHHHGMVITSAKSFSRNASAETEISTSGPYVVRLVDRGGVIDMLKKVPPSVDLERFLDEKYPTICHSPLSDCMAQLLMDPNLGMRSRAHEAV